LFEISPLSNENKPFLCRIGIHKWGKPTYINIYSSNVREWKKKCLRCGKVVRWFEPKEEEDDN